MPRGQLKINGQDAYTTWGMSLSDSALSALMAPAPNKAYITNKSRNENGTRIIADNAKVDERTVTLQMHITAPNATQFFNRYNALVALLRTGQVEIWTSLNPTECYRMYYLSCTQFSEYHRRLAKFTLRMVEPDPTDREVDRSVYPHLMLDRDQLDDQYSQLI